MRKFASNKLWRDKMPAIAEADGSIIHILPLSDEEYSEKLKDKLLEEAQEIVASTSKEEVLKEIADVLDVLDAFCKLHNLTKDEIAKAQAKKQEVFGGFAERKFVTMAEHPEGSKCEKYCLASPEKNPEIL
jgi:predicted house-cleaning noncanonical NTP pyrophosphatase (MazG superfamily)